MAEQPTATNLPPGEQAAQEAGEGPTFEPGQRSYVPPSSETMPAFEQAAEEQRRVEEKPEERIETEIPSEERAAQEARPALLEQPELPKGENITYVDRPDGTIEVIERMPSGASGSTIWRPTDTGYIQIGQQSGVARIPKFPSEEVSTALETYSTLTGRRQFDEAKRIGLIPKNAIYIPGETEQIWSFLTPTEGIRDLQKNEPGLYRTLINQGFNKYNQELGRLLAQQVEEQKKFEEANIQLADGKWIARTDWDNIPENFKQIGLTSGAGAMIRAMDKAEAKYNKALEDLAPYKSESGYDLFAAKRDGVSDTTLETLFEKEVVEETNDAVKAYEETGIALPGEQTYTHRLTGKTISASEYEKLITDYEQTRDRLAKEGKIYSTEWEALGSHPENIYALSPASSKRKLIEVGSAFVFAPVRALLPEVTIKDISGLEWGIGAAQLAAWSLPFIPKAVVPAASIGTAGTFAYATAKNWDDLSPAMKAIAIAGTALIATPALASITRAFKAVTVPTETGNVTVWRGVSVNGKPIFGISKGKPTIGARGIELPAATEIKAGYVGPETKIETNIVAVRKSLEKMGLAEPEINKIEATLRTRGEFAGKQSPYLTKEITPEAIRALNDKSVAEVFRAVIRNKAKIDKVYGSLTMKQQLAPELRQWRSLGDIDIQTNMTAAETEDFVKSLANVLKRTEGAKNVKISADSPYLIETRNLQTGKWRHAVDVHSYEQMPGSEVAPEGSYGLVHTEKAIDIEYPGYGKLKFMRLSESGKRKAASILEWQRTEGMTTIGPKAHRVKDIADYYVILKTFRGQKAADAWAKAFGYEPEELALVASESAPDLSYFEFDPNARVVTKSPGITVAPPASMIALAKSPALAMQAAGVSPSILATRQQISPSLAASLEASYAAGLPSSKGLPPSPQTSQSLGAAPSAGVTPSGAVRPSVGGRVSVGARPSVAVRPSPAVQSSPRGVPSARPSPAGVTSPRISPGGTKPKPVTTTSTVTSPSPGTIGTSSPRRGIVTLALDDETKKALGVGGSIAWRQGALKQRGVLKDVWWVIRWPYKSKADVEVLLGDAPPRAVVLEGPGSAYQTIQALTGKPPQFMLTLDMGIFDVKIMQPKKGAGNRPSIKFVRDVKQRTVSDISLSGVKV